MPRRAPRVIAIGDAIVDRITPPMPPLPRGDFQGHIEAFETLPGGNATNFALQIAALGSKSSPFEAALRILELGAGEVVIHRGKRGSARIASDGVTKMRAFSVPVENPTGCGDVFNAAYVYARLLDDSVSAALRFANAASALHIRDRRRPYPTLSGVRRFLASRSGRA